MDPRVKSSVLWGAVGALAFLVLAQGYTLLTSRGPGPLSTLGVALVVGVVVTALAYAAEGRLARKERV